MKQVFSFIVVTILGASSTFAAQSIDDALNDLTKLNPVEPVKAYQKIQELKTRWPEFTSNEQKARFFIYSGYHYLLKSEHKVALAQLKETLNLDGIPVKYKLSAYNLLSQIELNLKNYGQSFEYLFKAVNILDSEENTENHFSFYHSTANLFLDIEAWPEALEYSEFALTIARKEKNKVDECYALAQIDEIKLNQNTQINLTKNLNKIIEYCTDINANLVLANLHKNLAKSYMQKKQLSLALDNFNKSKSYLLKTPYLPEELEVLLYLAKLDFQNKAFGDSITKLDELISSAKDMPLSKVKNEALYLKAKIHLQLGEYSKSANYMDQAYQLNTTIQKDLASRNLAYQQVKHSKYESEAQVKMLDHENQLLKLNSEVQEQSKRTYQLFSIIAALFVALVTLMMLRMKKQKEQYRELSRKDSLTGIFSRRYVLHLAADVHSNSLSTKKSFSVIIFDLDYFKSINDKYGHAIGDWVLKSVAQKVSEQIREGDIFGRLGGEEFILILPDTLKKSAERLAMRCLDSFATIEHDNFDKGFNISASFGIATFTQAEDLETLIQSADDAMYKAKQMGRNQVFSFAQ